MIIEFRTALLLVLISLSTSLVLAQTSDSDRVVVKGEIIGFQPQKRCPDCGPVEDISHRAENLIFKVALPVDFAEKSKFILIDYAIYFRGISEKELYSARLELVLRKRPEDSANDCRGTIDFVSNNEKVWRPEELADYQLIKGYTAEDLPDFSTMPCYYGGTPPVNLDEDKNP